MCIPTNINPGTLTVATIELKSDATVLGGTLIVNYTKIGPKDKNVQKN